MPSCKHPAHEFQVQPNGVSVAQVVQDAIETVFKRRWPISPERAMDASVIVRTVSCTVDPALQNAEKSCVSR